MKNLFKQVKLSLNADDQIQMHNARADQLLTIISGLPDCREKSLAITKLEECIMWANKAAARHM